MKTYTRSKLFSLALIPALLLSACAPAANVAQSTLQRITSPQVPSADAQSLVNGNNAFALDIYQTLRSENGNLILSPFSISLALAMTYAGARGETESQMADTLHFDLLQGQLHPAFNALDQDLASPGKAKLFQEKPLQINIANAVWAEQTYPFLQDYLDLMASNYGSGIRLADFINKHEKVRTEINDWVYDETQKKIKDLIPASALNTDTRMVLVNAIYFKADWLSQFDVNETHDAPFHLLDGSDVTVKMMKTKKDQNISVSNYRGDGYQAVELPYTGDTAAMDILVPDEGNFEAFESSLNVDVLSTVLGNMQSDPIMVVLPKFKFESEFSLSDTLKSMGMVDAFDQHNADFSGMTAQHDLFISDVIHKAFVAVDEKGTEAGASTIVLFKLVSGSFPIIIDHPFIFIIRDKPSGQILFIGRVLDPSK